MSRPSIAVPPHGSPVYLLGINCYRLYLFLFHSSHLASRVRKLSFLLLFAIVLELSRGWNYTNMPPKLLLTKRCSRDMFINIGSDMLVRLPANFGSIGRVF